MAGMWQTKGRTNQRQSLTYAPRLAHWGRSNWVLIALLLAAFSLRLAWVLAFQTPPGPDAASYDELGWRLATGQGYVDDDGRPTAYWPVGYPAWLAAVYLVWGHSWLAAGVMNAVLGTVIVFLTYWLARQVVSTQQAILAAAIIAFLPSYVVAYTSNLRNETFYAVFVLLALITTVYAVRAPNWRTAISLGIVIGLGIYVRPTLLFFPSIFWVLLLLNSGLTPIRAISLTVLTGCIVIVTISPWTVRNLVVMDGLILTATNGGKTFYLGNGPGATGKHRRVDMSVFSDRFEMTVYREGFRKGVEHIVGDPIAWASILPTKVWYLWRSDVSSVAPYLLPARHQSHLGWLRVTGQSYYTAIVLVTLVGLCINNPLRYWRQPSTLLLILTLAYWTLFHMMFHGQGRFHMPMVPAIVVLAIHMFPKVSLGFRGLRSRGVASH